MLQIDSDLVDYGVKLEIHYVAPCTCFMCLVDTLIPFMRHSPMFSALCMNLRETPDFVLHKWLFAQHNPFVW